MKIPESEVPRIIAEITGDCTHPNANKSHLMGKWICPDCLMEADCFAKMQTINPLSDDTTHAVKALEAWCRNNDFDGYHYYQKQKNKWVHTCLLECSSDYRSFNASHSQRTWATCECLISAVRGEQCDIVKDEEVD